MSSVARERVRLAELVALLSLGTDLGLGQPMEHMIRACLIALRLGERLGLADSERGVVYYSGLLAWVGCHTDAYEQAKWFGDDAILKRDVHYYRGRIFGTLFKLIGQIVFTREAKRRSGTSSVWRLCGIIYGIAL